MRHALVAVAMFLLFPAAAAADPPTYEVMIQEGIQPRLSPSFVAGMAESTPPGMTALKEPGKVGAKVVRLECIDGTEIRNAFSNPSMHTDAPIWIVRMEGKFVEHRTPSGQGSRLRTRAYYVVDDGTGKVIAFGTSQPKARPAESGENDPE